jgi:hypothetical protein
VFIDHFSFAPLQAPDSKNQKRSYARDGEVFIGTSEQLRRPLCCGSGIGENAATSEAPLDWLVAWKTHAPRRSRRHSWRPRETDLRVRPPTSYRLERSDPGDWFARRNISSQGFVALQESECGDSRVAEAWPQGGTQRKKAKGLPDQLPQASATRFTSTRTASQI